MQESQQEEFFWKEDSRWKDNPGSDTEKEDQSPRPVRVAINIEYSDGFRTVIPMYPGHPFRSIPDSHSD